MISIGYINNGCEDSLFCDPCETFGRYLETCLDDIDCEYEELKSKHDVYTLESDIMGDADPYQNIVLEAEGKNFFAKLGNKIIEIYRKFTQMIDSLIQKLKDFTFKFKSNEQKMDKLLKQHPELGKEKIKILCDKGGLEFSDMKSISELDKEFYKIMKLYDDSKVDPKSFKGKCNNLIKKINDTDTSKVKATATVVGAGAAVISFAVGMHQYRSKVAEAKKQYGLAKTEGNKLQECIYQKLKKSLEKEGKDIEDLGKFQTALGMYRILMGKHQEAIKRNASIINKLNSAIASGMDKLLDNKISKKIFGDTKESLHDNMKYAHKEAKKEAKNEKKRKRKESEASRHGQLDADLSRLDDVAKVSHAQGKGKNKAEDDHFDIKLDQAEKLSGAQTRSKNKAEDDHFDIKLDQAEKLAHAQGKGKNKANNENLDNDIIRAAEISRAQKYVDREDKRNNTREDLNRTYQTSRMQQLGRDSVSTSNRRP